jgi:hypothetical protein
MSFYIFDWYKQNSFMSKVFLFKIKNKKWSTNAQDSIIRAILIWNTYVTCNNNYIYTFRPKCVDF